jgi:hypothetical protein
MTIKSPRLSLCHTGRHTLLAVPYPVSTRPVAESNTNPKESDGDSFFQIIPPLLEGRLGRVK